ncbi:MAG: hypothetical protein AAF490_02670 [Chloroflexota bacterium]
MTKLIDSTQIALLKRFVDGEVNDLEREQVKVILKKVVDGSLEEKESQEVLKIVDENEDALDILESIWMKQPLGQALANTPILEVEASERIRTGMVKRIRMSNTMGATVRLGTTGFGSVASSLLKPFVKKNKWESRRQRRRRRR